MSQHAAARNRAYDQKHDWPNVSLPVFKPPGIRQSHPPLPIWKMTKLRPRAPTQPNYHKRSDATNFSEWLAYRPAQEDPGYAQPAQADSHSPKRWTLALARAVLECGESATASMPPGARGAFCDVSRAVPAVGALPTSPTASPVGAMPTSPGASPVDGPSWAFLAVFAPSRTAASTSHLAQLHQTIAEGSRRFHVPNHWQSQAHVSLANAVRRQRIPCLDKLTDPVLREASAHHLLPGRHLQRRSQALLPFLSCRAVADAAADIGTVDHMGPAQQCGTDDLAVMHERRANVRALHGGHVWAVADIRAAKDRSAAARASHLLARTLEHGLHPRWNPASRPRRLQAPPASVGKRQASKAEIALGWRRASNVYLHSMHRSFGMSVHREPWICWMSACRETWMCWMYDIRESRKFLEVCPL